MLALRENPRVAATFGIDVRMFTLFSFMVAGVFAALGGALLAHNSEFVVANVFDFRLALLFVIMTVVGGLRSRAGVVIGSAFFALLGYLIETFHVEALLKSIPLNARPHQGAGAAGARAGAPPPDPDAVPGRDRPAGAPDPEVAAGRAVQSARPR